MATILAFGVIAVLLTFAWGIVPNEIAKRTFAASTAARWAYALFILLVFGGLIGAIVYGVRVSHFRGAAERRAQTGFTPVWD